MSGKPTFQKNSKPRNQNADITHISYGIRNWLYLNDYCLTHSGKSIFSETYEQLIKEYCLSIKYIDNLNIRTREGCKGRNELERMEIFIQYSFPKFCKYVKQNGGKFKSENKKEKSLQTPE